MNNKISIVCPGIRNNKWAKVVNSFKECVDIQFEFIFIGPYKLPSELENKKNIKYVRDFGHPNRCQQIGATLAKYPIFTLIADDGIFLPAFQHSLDLFIELYQENKKSIVSLKYGEGGNYMTTDSYYYMYNAYPFINNMPKDMYILNGAILSTDYFHKLGGWDCQFETTCMGHADFAMRAYSDKASVVLDQHIVIDCEHMPGTTGDHAPIHYAQIEHDIPLFKNIYSQTNRPIVHMDNWKQASACWYRRFT